MKIKVGFGLGTIAGAAVGADDFWTVVDHLEGTGWDSLWLSERLTSAVAEPVVAMAAVAGRTRRLRFGPSVLVVPGRNPVVLAKALATLDVLSSGRLICVFGLGSDFPAEHEAFGIERRERAARTDEAVALMRRLWTERDVTHEGQFFRVTDFTLEPRVVQRPCPDIWFGGHSAPALRRVARLGTGWLPSFVTAAEYPGLVAHIRAFADDEGREIEDDHFGCLVPYVPEGADASAVLAAVAARRRDAEPKDVVVTGGAAELAARIAEFAGGGASKFVIVPTAVPRDWTEELDLLHAEVVQPSEKGGS